MLGHICYPEFSYLQSSFVGSLLMQPQGLDIALNSSGMAQGRAIPRTAKLQWQFQVSLATCRMPPWKGLLLACFGTVKLAMISCNLRNGIFGWLLRWLHFLYSFNQLDFCDRQKWHQALFTNSHSHSFFPKHCSLFLDCLLKDLWVICLFCFTEVSTRVFGFGGGFCGEQWILLK